ncbi:MAG: GAF domain-containing protein [Rhodobacteraceae bacterium]|jgi:hypothetical protein|nr:GAF domain-containing protein [Paracoccaceae bacterium]
MTDAALLARVAAAPDLYPAMQAATAELVGHRLFTLMAIDHARGEAARIYTSHPAEYPVGGRKPLGNMTDWGRIVIEGQQPWIARTMDDIRFAFFDHALIESLGCASCLNMPVVDPDAAGGPRVIGTMNLLDVAHHYTPDHAARLAAFAALLVDPYRAWAAAAH